MRWFVLLCAWQFGCGADEPQPPELRGDHSPPCELADARHFLIDDVRVPDGTEVPIDIDDDGFIDTWNYPYRVVAPATKGRLALALTDAFARHTILWVLSTQECVDGESKYVRAAIRPGVSFESQPVPTVTVQSDDFHWAIGTREGDTISASLGFGAIPVAANVDLDASTSATDWQTALLVSLNANMSLPVEGTIVAAFDPTAARDAFSRAIARTLTDMKTLEPTCPQCTNEDFALLIRAFDTNQDGLFDPAEVEASGYLEFFGLQPRLDLFATFMDENRYWPAHDGIVDSLGASFAFHATEVQAN